MMNNNCIVTILSVVFNDVFIEETIQSVLPFLSDEVEYLIVDGKSTDGTLDIIRKYSDKLRFISEGDNGIYDAMQKGINLANGEFILHLNSGDFLLDLPLEQIKNLCSSYKIVALAFPVMNGNTMMYPSYDKKLHFFNTLHHQGTFYRKSILSYDLKYRIFADFDMNQRLYKLGRKVLVQSSPVICRHLLNGVSCSGNRWEYYMVIKNNFGLITFILSICYHFYLKMKKIVHC